MSRDNARQLGPGWARPGAAAIGVALSASGIATLVPSCSLIVDKNASQCTTDADCSGFPGTGCEVDPETEEGVCVAKAALSCDDNDDCAASPGTLCRNGTCGAPDCTQNAECIEREGDYHVCRKVDGTCVSLVSEQCTTVYGDYDDDAAVLIGSILPTAGPDETTGKAIENSITLGINDFAQTTNGLPPVPGQTKRRPIVLVGCNDDSDADTAVKAAMHLVETVRVPAIIGAAFSGITIKLSTEVTIPGGTLVISPSATSVAITDLDDGGLVWRTSPSDVFQADALALRVPEMETQVRQELGLAEDDPVDVAIAHKGDAYGRGLGEALEKKLEVNGKPVLDPANKEHYLRVNYGDPDDPKQGAPKYGETVAKVLGLKPHVTLVFGTNEAVEKVFIPIEDQWEKEEPVVTYRSRFLFSDGGLISELWGFVGGDDDLRKRVGGTVPGTNNAIFTGFKSNYSTQFSDDTDPAVFGAAGGYDSLYLLAYAVVALGDEPITGASLAKGLAKTVPAAEKTIPAGTDGINKAFPILSAGKNVDFDGASGPLDFDVESGEAPSDIQIWCLPKSQASGKATSAVNSGLFFSAADKELQGSIGSICD